LDWLEQELKLMTY